VGDQQQGEHRMSEHGPDRHRREEPGARLLTVAQVAVLMQLSRSSVYRLVATGRLPRVQIGRAARVPESAVDELLRHTLPPELA
jgi:excisionase family DNA binding protein